MEPSEAAKVKLVLPTKPGAGWTVAVLPPRATVPFAAWETIR